MVAIAWGASVTVAVAGGVLHVPEEVFDFGEQPNTVEVSHDFVLRNAGDAPLSIRDIKSGCGCTVAAVDTSDIPPGGETCVTVRFKLAGRNGPQDKSVAVETDDSARPVAILRLRGIAYSEIALAPAALLFGRVWRDGGTRTRRVELRMRPPVRFLDVDGNGNGALTVTWDRHLGEGTDRTVLEVALNPASSPKGPFSENLEILTDSTNTPRVKLPVTAVIVSDD